jgi:hypothetical protein
MTVDAYERKPEGFSRGLGVESVFETENRGGVYQVMADAGQSLFKYLRILK